MDSSKNDFFPDHQRRGLCIWPDVFTNPDLVKSSSHKELLADRRRQDHPDRRQLGHPDRRQLGHPDRRRLGHPDRRRQGHPHIQNTRWGEGWSGRSERPAPCKTLHS